MSEIVTVKKGMQNIFENTLRIPEYQREYAWDNEQVDDFIGDLLKFSESDEKEYVFGSIIAHVCDSEDYHEIVDGQQRLCTVSICFKVLLELFRAVFDPSDPEILTITGTLESSLTKKDPSGIRKPKLIMNSKNLVFYNEFIIKEDHKYKAVGKSDKLVKKAYFKIQKKISECIEDLDIVAKRTYLCKISNKLLKGFISIYVQTDSSAQAHIIFETLNNRGKKLKVHELLKNYFFEQSKDPAVFINKWERLVLNFDDGDDITPFIRYFWNSTHGIVRTNSLFKAITLEINKDNVDDFVNKLIEASYFYKDLTKNNKNSYFTSESSDSIYKINLIGAKTQYPLLIAARNSGYDKKDFEILLKSIETIFFRNQTIMNNRNNSNEDDFATLAVQISNGLKVDDAVKQIHKLTIDDDQILFKLKDFKPNRDKAHLILKLIYDKDLKDLQIPNERRKVHLEHIMPQNNSIWKVDETIHEEYHVRLGNLTLLFSKINESIKNDEFYKKKEKYKDSNIPENKLICECDQWTFKEIEERQERLAQRIISGWPID